MKKKVFSLMMTLVLAFMGVAKAEVVTIGEGTSTTYVTPFNSLWGYSFVEQIFTADEIGTAGTINAISFNMSSTNSQTNQVDVFMKAVTRSSFSGATDYEAVTANDMVFSGTVTFSPGWTGMRISVPASRSFLTKSWMTQAMPRPVRANSIRRSMVLTSIVFSGWICFSSR